MQYPFRKAYRTNQDALSAAFETNTHGILNALAANISENPVCQRFFEERYFDLFCKNSESGALGISILESIRCVWSYVWNLNFADSYDKYEAQSLKWLLSEMAVESIMGDVCLISINPEFPRGNGGCVYPYSQYMKMEGKPVLDTMDKYTKATALRFFEDILRLLPKA